VAPLPYRFLRHRGLDGQLLANADAGLFSNGDANPCAGNLGSTRHQLAPDSIDLPQ
jgi:hypothetical protein